MNKENGYQITISNINDKPALVIKGNPGEDWDKLIEEGSTALKKFKMEIFIQHSKPASQPTATPTQPIKELKGFCEEHDMDMKQMTSKKTGKPYWVHWNDDNKPCFGRGFQK